MEITKYYSLKSRKSIQDRLKVKTESGNTFYLTQRVFSHVEKNPGISYLELMLSLYRDCGQLVLPPNVYVNNIHIRISKSVQVLKRYGYIRSEREIASNGQEDLHYRMTVLCKGLKILGKTPPTFTFKGSEIPIRALNFDEMIRQTSIGLSMVAPLLVSPQTKYKILGVTGYKEGTLFGIIGALNYLHLLENKNERYFLTKRPEKRQDLLTLLRQCQVNKERFADRLRRSITAIEMLEKGESYGNISLFTGFSAATFKVKDFRPRFRRTTAEILHSEGHLSGYHLDRLKDLELLK